MADVVDEGLGPVDGDLARDLRADLATVEAATPGPWAADVPAGHVYNPDWLRLGWDRGIVATTDDDADTRAIAAMRDGWPAAIRRALAAEGEVARLRATLEGLARTAGDATVTDGDTSCCLGWWVKRVLEGGAR